jgi:hypothetical protein
MLGLVKVGIVDRGPAAERALRMEREHRGWWPFSYSLLADLDDCYTPADEPLLDRLYRSMAAGDGVFKITQRGRFASLDAMLAEHCSQHYRGLGQIVVHDMGASNGITSLELHRTLGEVCPVKLFATDLYDRLYLVRLPRSGWTVALDAAGRPLQFANKWFVFSAYRREAWRYPCNVLVQALCRRHVLREAIEIFRRGDSNHVRTVQLFHPECLAASRRDPELQFGQHDLFKPNPHRCQIVRVMNLLTPDHLTDAQIRSAVPAIVHNLHEQGLLVVGRSVDEQDHRCRATAFGWDGRRLSVAWRCNEGCEGEKIILGSFDA